jgi:predicted acyl esterase
VRKLYLIPAWLYLILGCCADPAIAAPKPIVKYLNVPVAMREGVRLSANVSGLERARMPAILVRTPHSKGADISAIIRPL